VLPDIAKNVAEPLSKVDKITMYGEGNTAKLVGDIINGTTQVTDGMMSGLGIDLKSILNGFLGGLAGAKATKGETVSPIDIPVEDTDVDDTPDAPVTDENTVKQ